MTGGFCYTLFDTALGRCGIAWGPRGVKAVSFAENADKKTIARLARRAPGAAETKPTIDIALIIEKIRELFNGDDVDFDGASLDFSAVAEFDAEVLKLTRAIRTGDTKTYGDIAKALGDVSLSRRVGQALGRNPFPIIVPCHRVVSADGTMTGFSAPGGIALKEQLLKIEGALAPDLFDAAK